MSDAIFISLLALLIFGPKKLPEIVGQAGKYLAQFRRMRSAFLEQVKAEILSLDEEKPGQEESAGSR